VKTVKQRKGAIVLRKGCLIVAMFAIAVLAQTDNDYIAQYGKIVDNEISKQNAAIDEYIRKENEVIAKYTNQINKVLGINYSYEKDTTAVNALVSMAIIDSTPTENLVNAVKVLDNGIKSGVNEDDALDVAQLVSYENVKVTPEQTVAFSEAREIVKENNVDAGATDELLYNAIRVGKSGGEMIAGVKSFIKEKLTNKTGTSAQSYATPPSGEWQGKMDGKIKDFLKAKTKYKWGGTSLRGVDCSGFTQICYNEIGVTIPRVSRDQHRIGKKVNTKDAKFGDLILFYGNPAKFGRITHVGLVYNITPEGDVNFVHSSSSKGVGYNVLGKSPYWQRRFAVIKRVVD
jgi:hypothetical protein